MYIIQLKLQLMEPIVDSATEELRNQMTTAVLGSLIWLSLMIN